MADLGWANELPVSESQDWVIEVKNQIEKDFGLCGFIFDSESYETLESLLPELTNQIEIMQQKQHGLWMKIVYRVDLTEKQYRFVQKMGGSTPENMSKAVVLREFQKVYTRKKFS